MITKTEVTAAIARCERYAGFAAIDSALVPDGAVQRGDLLVLIEAAKTARFSNMHAGWQSSANSASEMVLADE